MTCATKSFASIIKAMKTKTIRQSRFVSARPMDVYKAFVDAKKHSAFTGGKATGVGRVGGRFTAWDGYIAGKHLILAPGKRIVQEWVTSEWPEEAEPSRLEWVFKSYRGGCVVRMIHSKIPASQAAAYRQGWIDHYWNPLIAYFAEK